MKARLLVIKEATSPNTSEDLRSALNEVSALLNDAGSTIASLNLTKNITDSKKRIDELSSALNNGRDYLMQTEPSEFSVEAALEAFGFGKNGLTRI